MALTPVQTAKQYVRLSVPVTYLDTGIHPERV